MKQVVCPHCQGEFPASEIPDDVLLSERGRRNSAKVVRGRPMIWKEHHPEALHCLCWDCRWLRFYRQESAFLSAVERNVVLTGVRPSYYDDKIRAFTDWRTRLLGIRPAWAPADPPQNPFRKEPTNPIDNPTGAR